MYLLTEREGLKGKCLAEIYVYQKCKLAVSVQSRMPFSRPAHGNPSGWHVQDLVVGQWKKRSALHTHGSVALSENINTKFSINVLISFDWSFKSLSFFAGPARSIYRLDVQSRHLTHD